MILDLGPSVFYLKVTTLSSWQSRSSRPGSAYPRSELGISKFELLICEFVVKHCDSCTFLPQKGMMDSQLKKSFIAEIANCQSLIVSVVRRAKTFSSVEKEDLVQEILLNAWKSYPKFRGDSKFSTWLYRIGVLTVFQAYRNAGYVQKFSLEGLEHRHPVAPVVWSPDAELERLLDERELKTFRLYIEGYTYEEMGLLLGISASLVGVRIHRTKKKLAKVYRG